MRQRVTFSRTQTVTLEFDLANGPVERGTVEIFMKFGGNGGNSGIDMAVKQGQAEIATGSWDIVKSVPDFAPPPPTPAEQRAMQASATATVAKINANIAKSAHRRAKRQPV